MGPFHSPIQPAQQYILSLNLSSLKTILQPPDSYNKLNCIKINNLQIYNNLPFCRSPYLGIFFNSPVHYWQMFKEKTNTSLLVLYLRIRGGLLEKLDRKKIEN
jgi:hypothetical protein